MHKPALILVAAYFTYALSLGNLHVRHTLARGVFITAEEILHPADHGGLQLTLSQPICQIGPLLTGQLHPTPFIHFDRRTETTALVFSLYRALGMIGCFIPASI